MGSGASKTGRGEKQTNVPGGFRDREQSGSPLYKAGDRTKIADSGWYKGIPITISRTFKTSKGSFVEYKWKTSSGKERTSILTRETFFNRLWGGA